MNPRAETLFGHSFREWSGRPCHVCIRGVAQDGVVCCPRCRVRQEADEGSEIAPVRMQVASAPESREVSVVVIVAQGDTGRLLVHCAVDDERERRLQRFLDGVVHRSKPLRPTRVRRGSALTGREREVLSMLATDASLHEIAGELSVSYTTVRNHVQHILSKLGVHSILEAAALWMMEEDGR